MNITELHRVACQQFGDLVRKVGDEQWTAGTPCADWDVRALVNHVTAEDLWTSPLLAGSTIAAVGDAFDGDILGDDPSATYDRAAGAAISAGSGGGALGRTGHVSDG